MCEPKDVVPPVAPLFAPEPPAPNEPIVTTSVDPTEVAGIILEAQTPAPPPPEAYEEFDVTPPPPPPPLQTSTIKYLKLAGLVHVPEVVVA